MKLTSPFGLVPMRFHDVADNKLSTGIFLPLLLSSSVCVTIDGGMDSVLDVVTRNYT